MITGECIETLRNLTELAPGRLILGIQARFG